MIDFSTVKMFAKAAVADRKGATALEYALIAAAVAGIVLTAYKTMFNNLAEFLGGIQFAT